MDYLLMASLFIVSGFAVGWDGRAVVSDWHPENHPPCSDVGLV